MKLLWTCNMNTVPEWQQMFHLELPLSLVKRKWNFIHVYDKFVANCEQFYIDVVLMGLRFFRVYCNRNTGWPNKNRTFLRYHIFAATTDIITWFLPCDAVCTVSVIVIPSVRPSVCPSVRPSVCPSVCHTRGLCPHGSTYDHDFFTTG